MTEQLYETYGEEIEQITLISGSNGVYEVEVDGHLVYSKKATKRHANFDEVHEAIQAL